MFFDSTYDLLRVVVVGTLAYFALVVLLRLSGNRTLSKMNAFDFVVTVALGSTLATILLTDRVALAEGIVAFTLLIGLQLGVTSLAVRSPRFHDIITSAPVMLYFRGAYLPEQMRRSRVVEEEILSAVRSQGIASMSEVTAVVLESDGTFTVLTGPASQPSALANINVDVPVPGEEQS